MPSPLEPWIARLMPVMIRGDVEEFRRVVEALSQRARTQDPATLTAAVSQLAPILAGACVEWGASPAPLAGPVEGVANCCLLSVRYYA